LEKKQNNLFDYYINKCYGITQDPITKDFTMVMNYCKSGDLKSYITSKFNEMSWQTKLYELMDIIRGLEYLHSKKIIHRDLHSGNILKDDLPKISDLGLSKSATVSTNDEDIYGVIPYVAPEIFQKKNYNIPSDIYSFGMIMWEFMTGRRPFWNRAHDAELIIDIHYGLRPPITTNAPKGYIELMQRCWNSDPSKRPTATDIKGILDDIWKAECNSNISTEIIRSPDIGPMVAYNLGAIYSSRSLSSMITSAISIISSRSWSIVELGNVLKYCIFFCYYYYYLK